MTKTSDEPYHYQFYATVEKTVQERFEINVVAPTRPIAEALVRWNWRSLERRKLDQTDLTRWEVTSIEPRGWS